MAEHIADWLAGRVASLLGVGPESVPHDMPFTHLGLSSVQAVELSDDLQRWLGVELSATLAYDYPTIDAVAAHVAERLAADTEAAPGAAVRSDAVDHDAVAVVGIGCRVPGASGPEAYWKLLTGGVDAIREVPADRWDADAYYDPDPQVPGRMNTRWGGFLDDAEGFDAEFFGVSAREAARMDPQQRLALEVAWEALEDAGIAPSGLSGSRTGVYMGVATFDHGSAMLGRLDGAEAYDGTGGALSIVANRLSYVLNLRGPSMVVDSACSSSLVAVHLAAAALRAGEAELALAGGVNVITSPRIALSFSRSGLMAADGRCKPFDARADGYVRSEGAGVVVLKPLARALADGDRVYAVILGGAVNQDGRTNGLTAPNRPAQEAALAAAYQAAGVDPGTVAYVEAHGTGTAVGDPIEVGALATVLCADRPADRPLLIGSAKSNIGHLEAAAGVAGLIKTALSLHHRTVPPTVHFDKPNPLLGLDRIPVVVPAQTEPWPGWGEALAGVSSFGFGGTNAHLVLAAAPAPLAPNARPSTDEPVDVDDTNRPGVASKVADHRTTATAAAETDHRSPTVRGRVGAHDGLLAGIGAGAVWAPGADSPDPSHGDAAAIEGPGGSHSPATAGNAAEQSASSATSRGGAVAARGAGEGGDRSSAPLLSPDSASSAHPGGPSELGAGFPLLFPVSGRSPEALVRRAGAWAGQADASDGDPVWAVRAAAAAAVRADHDPVRAAVVASSAGELAEGLRALADGKALPGTVGPRTAARRRAKTVLVFPGQGPQWPGMGRRLAAVDPVFRDELRRVDAELAVWLGHGLWDDELGLVAEGTAQVQPALFALQVALAASWRARGVAFDAVVGHSMGEIAAAHVAGALDLADAARIACERSRLLTGLTGRGGMAVVELDAAGAEALVAERPGELAVAAVNGPRATVLSGTPEALDDVVAELTARAVFARRIAVEFAAHSPQVEPVQPELFAALRGIAPRDGGLAFYSTVTGTPVPGATLGPEYWRTNLRATVRFAPAVERLLADGFDTFVELTPHPVLARPLAELVGGDATVVSSLRREDDEAAAMLGALGELYADGVPVDWSALHPAPVPHVPVPRHGWSHRRFPAARPFTGSGSGSGVGATQADGLLGPRVRVAAQPGLGLWPLAVDAGSAPELAEHVVEDLPLVAGAYWLTAAAEAAAGADPAVPVTLTGVDFAAPCPAPVSEQPQLTLVESRFTVASWGEGTPVTHASGGVAPAGPRPPAEDLEAARARCAETLDVDALYRALEEAGLRYGPRFRGLAEAWAGSGEAVARVVLPSGLPRYRPGRAQALHPAHLDACLHTVAAATSSAHGGVPLPAGADEVWSRHDGTPPETVWCHARLVSVDGRRIVADVTVADDEGVVLWAARGLRVALSAPRRAVETGRLYDVVWRPLDETAAEAAGSPGDWLVLDDGAGVAQQLALRLIRAGGHTLITDPDTAGGYQAVFADAEARFGALRGVLDARALAGPGDAPDLDGPDPLPALRALRVAQAVAAYPWAADAPRLWLAVADGDLSGGAVWGLGRVAANELSESGCSLLGLDDPRDPEAWDAAGAALLEAYPPAQQAVRAGVRVAPELVAASGVPDAPTTIRADRRYVLTGGLGVLGLLVARRLVERGARHLLLLGRSAPSEAAERELAALRARGADVRTARADAADRGALAAALATSDVPVAGVFHLAGVLENALLPDLTGEGVLRAFAGKASGAWHLHELTADQPVELFVLFSSLAGLVGSPGQAAYAAANGVLDALAFHRQARGLPAQSVAWGPWAEAGLALQAGADGLDRLAARGIPALDPRVGVALFDDALDRGAAHMAAAAFVPEALRGAGWGPAARQVLAGLLPETSDGPAAPDVRAALAGAAAGEPRTRLLREFLTGQVASVLGATAAGVPSSVPFQDLGFDSLMAVELRDRLEAALTVKLSATLVYAHPTVAALTRALLDRMGLADVEDAPGNPVTASNGGSNGASNGHTPDTTDPDDGLEDLDDAELAALLAAELDALAPVDNAEES
ncbi:type I polyketide synthase [Yinghuangia seranimata]|uniref:type I polyketide synthase n=1 Tax=Yinghuangia seranimata TaxID=408067 RepID=UPI00248C6D9C|nr:type I polyketide synthase [Yinghuangia seranimata]MDI2127659.1 SDR family NAD(P)-dependent oxidoreductase [Yinghuangia seranimata]